jgi:hypothetical protein
MRRPSPATIIASIALFFSLAGTGLAASKYLITSTKQIKPSVLHSLKGAQGTRGLQGIQGLAGPAGAAGAAGTSGGFNAASETVVTGSTPSSIPNTGAATATSVASCPAGDVVISGGYEWGLGGNPPNTIVVQTDSPQGTTGWAVTMANDGTVALTTPEFAAQAVCAS